MYGTDQEVIIEQRHTPGERAQSDFTHMEDLGIYDRQRLKHHVIQSGLSEAAARIPLLRARRTRLEAYAMN